MKKLSSGQRVDGEEFCRLYDITQIGNFTGKSIPNRVHTSENGWAMEDPRLEKLYCYRLNRTKLHKDDKILLSWNAWVMIALAKAGQVLEELSYLDAAIHIQIYIGVRKGKVPCSSENPMGTAQFQKAYARLSQDLHMSIWIDGTALSRSIKVCIQGIDC